MSVDEQGYNGWTNYETWATALWMDNEEGSYNYVRELARDILAEYEDEGVESEAIGRSTEGELADKLKDEYEEGMPELEGIWADLLGVAFSEIDWYEIAHNILTEVAE